MKNLKIFLIASIIALASVGCGEEGGSGVPTPGTTALSGKVGLSDDANQLAADAQELVDQYTGNEKVTNAVENLANLAQAIEDAETQEELDAATEAFAAAMELFLSAASEVATPEELAAITSSTEELVESANEVTSIEITIDVDEIISNSNNQDIPLDETGEVAEQEEITEEEIIESTEQIQQVAVDTIKIHLILNINQECPLSTESTIYNCSYRENIVKDIFAGEECPVDTDRFHFICNLVVKEEEPVKDPEPETPKVEDPEPAKEK